MRWTHYPLTRIHRTKRGKCVDCGKRTSRTKTFEASSNRFNDYPSEGTLLEILYPVADSWLKAPIRCQRHEEEYERKKRRRENDEACRKAKV